jgi:hypothetical protein
MSHRSLSATFLTVTFALSVFTTAKPQDGPTPQERQEAVRVSKVLSARLQETDDIAQLIPEFFAPDFLGRIPSSLCAENVAAAVCREVSREERLRTYVATFNLVYFSTLDEMSRGDTTGKAFEKMLPVGIADRLRRTRLLGKGQRVETVEQFREQLSLLEQALAEARDHLLRNPVETPQKYQERVSFVEKYMEASVRVWTAKQVREEYFDTGLPAEERLFVVHTAFNLELLLMKDGGALKVLTLMPADD